MPGTTPIRAAEQVFRDLIEFRAEGEPTPSFDRFLDAVRRFGSVEFDVPDAPDADGFLFQYGTFKWLPEPAFVVGIARQFDILDESGDHVDYIQIQAEYSYPIDPDLEALGGREQWWFRDGPESFGEWLTRVISAPVWDAVRSKSVLRFSISQEVV